MVRVVCLPLIQMNYRQTAKKGYLKHKGKALPVLPDKAFIGIV